MTRNSDPVVARKKLRQTQDEEELEVYKMAFGDSEVFYDDGLLAEEKRHAIPRLTVAAYQIRAV